ncbi:MAG: phosphotransferase [Promicromonosporaceae bacterium]|nr:phosphotransferase [Promicromonosporaceae bacterium]
MPRITWPELPAGLRLEIERQVGGTVAEWTSQPGGFSPGVADRLLLDDGQRVFVKVVAAAADPFSITIHRREIDVLTKLAEVPGFELIPHARLLGHIDTAEWAVVILQDVAGREPSWAEGELDAVLDVLPALAELPLANVELPDLRTSLSPLFRGWDRLAADPEVPLPYEDDLNAWIAAHLNALRALSAEALDLASGDALVHVDLRADNLLLRSTDCSPVLLDWPWAAVGSRWFDPVGLLLDAVYRRPGYDIDLVLGTHPIFAEIPADTAERFFAGLAGYFTHAALQLPPPALPTVRKFQRDQGEAALRWLRTRLG